jgi:RimJ/RimL family protein N-acetyltransferase
MALVTFGGSDPDEMSAPILEALYRFDASRALEVTVVVGPSHRNAETSVRLGECLGPRCQVLRNTNEMPSLMDQADVAIGNAGSTAWEMAFMGLPAVLVVAADNQVGVAEGLQALGVAWSCGRSGGATVLEAAERVVSLLAARATRQAMSSAGQALVDGYGADRVVAAMIGSGVWLRRAGPADCRRVWEWANEEAARAASFSSDPIPWSDHEKWFDARLREERCRILIACDADDREIGYVRMEAEAESDDATISICVAPERRGRGLGRRMIERAMAAADAWQPDRRVHAYIRPENAASARAFAAAGFSPAGEKVISGVRALHYLHVRPGGTTQ